MQAHQSDETAARRFTNAKRAVACDVCREERFTDVASFLKIQVYRAMARVTGRNLAVAPLVFAEQA